jgi:hypothetical protein
MCPCDGTSQFSGLQSVRMHNPADRQGIDHARAGLLVNLSLKRSCLSTDLFQSFLVTSPVIYRLCGML